MGHPLTSCVAVERRHWVHYVSQHQSVKGALRCMCAVFGVYMSSQVVLVLCVCKRECVCIRVRFDI